MSGTGGLQASVGAPAPGSATAVPSAPSPQDTDHTPSTPGPEPGPAGAPGRPSRVLFRGGVAAAVLPFLVSAVAVFLGVGGDYHPVADVAATEMLTRDVGRYEILLGPFSRDGWHHPGPAMFYVLAVPYRLLGSGPAALSAGALLVGAASVAGMAAIARRRGGTPLLASTLLACGLLVRALGFEFLATPWNPWVTVLPYGLLVMLTWAMACGERWALPVATLVATFLVQTHVGYAALALPLLALGALWLVATTLRPRPTPSSALPTRGPWRRWSAGRRLAGAGALAGLVAVVAWAPPVVQQLTGEPGNLGVILRWFREHGDDVNTLGDGWRVVTAQFGLPPEWLAGKAEMTIVEEPGYLVDPLVPVLLVVVVAAAVAGWRRPGGDARRLLVVWLVASVLGVVAVARTVGVLYAYRLAWAQPLAAVAGAYCLWVAWAWVARRSPTAERRVLVPGAVAVLAVVAVVDVVAAARAGTPAQRSSALVTELGAESAAALPPGDGPVTVRPTSFTAIGMGTGLIGELERHGVDARYSALDAASTDHRRPPTGAPLADLVVVADADIPEAVEDPELELVAYAGDLTLDELGARVAELRELEEAYAREQDDGADEPDDVAHINAVRALVPPGSVIAVFLGPT